MVTATREETRAPYEAAGAAPAVPALPRARRKPPVRRVPSDDCALLVGGEAYYPHTGEWVEVVGGFSVQLVRGLGEIAGLGVTTASLEGEPDAERRQVAAIGSAFDDICRVLAQRVVAWTWTDERERPLPTPDGTPTPFLGLRAEELGWLLRATMGEVPAEQGKG